MAKKQIKTAEEERQSRKEILRARRHQEQMRQVRIGIAIVVGLLVLVALVGVVNEVFLIPNRAVATVNGEKITLQAWQKRVVYDRAQRIISLERQYEAFGGDVGIIQQFAGQTIIDLQDQNAQTLAENTLNTMIEETIIRQQAEARGIKVTDADVQETIGGYFYYYGGESPTPLPTGTATVMPTPSLTPIPTPVITDVVPTTEPFPTPTLGPTGTPLPTATPVTEESFNQEYSDLLARYKKYNVDEDMFRETVRAGLYRERLQDALGVENEVDTVGEQASVFILQFATEADANEALALVSAEGYLTLWNTVRSTPLGTTDAAFTGATATEYLWQTQDTLVSTIGADAAAAAFSLPIDEPSAVLTQAVEATGTSQYYIIQVSGREVRDLPQSMIDAEKASLLTALVNAQLAENVETTTLGQTRIPKRPLLDPKFLAQPTAAPVEPTIPAVEPTVPAVEPTPAE